MCRGVAWLEPTALVTFGEKCQRQTHGFLNKSCHNNAFYVKKNGVNTRVQTSTVSCGGVVIYRRKVLLLYKNQHGKYMGWVLPKGNLEQGETHKAAALREVKEESGVTAKVIKYLGKTQYSFYSSTGHKHQVSKTVHWYLMTTSSFYCKPQAEEYFADVGFYKQHEAYHLLKFHDERQIMRQAFAEYTNQKLNKGKEVNQNVQNKRVQVGPETPSL